MQVASCLYQNGVKYIGTMLERLEEWMAHHRFKNIQEFNGKLSQDKSVDPSVYERVQFLRYYGGKKGAVT